MSAGTKGGLIPPGGRKGNGAGGGVADDSSGRMSPCAAVRTGAFAVGGPDHAEHCLHGVRMLGDSFRRDRRVAGCADSSVQTRSSSPAAARTASAGERVEVQPLSPLETHNSGGSVMWCPLVSVVLTPSAEMPAQGPQATHKKYETGLLVIIKALVEWLGGVAELLETIGILGHRIRAVAQPLNQINGALLICPPRDALLSAFPMSRIACSTGGQFFSRSGVSGNPALSAATRASVNAFKST